MCNSAVLDEQIDLNSSKITNFENDVLKLICEEKNLKDISGALGVGKCTIQAYKMSIFHKFQVKNIQELKRKLSEFRLKG